MLFILICLALFFAIACMMFGAKTVQNGTTFVIVLWLLDHFLFDYAMFTKWEQFLRWAF